MIDVDEKQMYDNVILGKENTSNIKIGIVLYRCFWYVNVYFVFGYACFLCICPKIAIWLFL